MENTRLQKWLNLGSSEYHFDLTSEQKQKVAYSYESLIKILSRNDEPVYGLHTGYGSNVLSERNPSDWQKVQSDLLEYLKVGVGTTLPEAVVRRALRLQILKTAQGHSGIHPQTVEDLIALSNAKVLPAVPCLGSLGASGDLIPMAHAIAPIFENSKPRSPRDVIGLVNTNSMMASYAIECWNRLDQLFNQVHQIVALTMKAVNASEAPVSPALTKLRVQDQGYSRSSEQIRKHLSALPTVSIKNKLWLQARYSIRCAPMVLGNARELLDFALQKITQDAESVADNPVMIHDEAELQMMHAGLFYAASTATAADLMNDAAGKVCEMLDRQVLILMDPKLSEGLPENLQFEGFGHLKGLHQLLSALNQQMRTHSAPSRALSFSCEGNNQDIVPCAMSALNQLNSALEIADQAVRVAGFVTARAYCLRVQKSLPEELSLKKWNQFEVSNLNIILEKVVAGFGLTDQAA